jgi:methylphosphotriester-DNA--protein-cysteine methyltransferase
VRDGLLIHDPVVAAVLQGQPLAMSLRTVQRRFLKATGLTQGTVSQIQRARFATTLLKQGMPILDVVDRAGYSDQPHLSRSLKRLIGQTPAQLLSQDREDVLSFLFKTESL